MTQPNLGEYRKGVDGNFFNTLTNTHPNQKDPRNDQDYDTFLYGTEPIPGDTTWGKMAKIRAGLKPRPQWKGVGRG